MRRLDSESPGIAGSGEPRNTGNFALRNGNGSGFPVAPFHGEQAGTSIAETPDMAKKQQRSDDADAFIRESEQGTGSREDLSALLGEEYVRAVTSGDDVAENDRDAVLPEEMGGPFLESDGGEEFGRTVSGLPDDAEEERSADPNPFPAVVGALGVAGPDEREARLPGDAVLDDDEEEEVEEQRFADAEPASEVEPDREVLAPETEQSSVRKRY